MYISMDYDGLKQKVVEMLGGGRCRIIIQPGLSALLVALKWDQSSEGAIRQIRDKKYMESLREYKGNLLLVGINYDKASKAHQCIIEKA